MPNIDLLVGSYAEPNQTGLYHYCFDHNTGELQFKSAVSGITNPSYLCLSQDADRAFVVSEYKSGDRGRVTLYKLDGSKPIVLLDAVCYEGSGSCYITRNRADEHIFVANYVTGSLTVLELIDGGRSALPVQTLLFEGSGPNKERQEKSHIHAVVLSTDQRMLYCTDLGADRLYAFHYDSKADVPLLAADPAYIDLPPGSGPRHLACSPNGRWLYLICELSGEIFLFEQGRLQTWKQCCSVVPEGFNGEVAAAAILINVQGTCLYATNRGDADQLVVFAIDDAQDGKLERIQYVSSQGKGPRSIALDPSGRFLLAANEMGNNITVFVVAPLDGKLIYTGQSVHLTKPTCLKFTTRI